MKLKCLLDQKLVDCKVIEDLGYQGGKYAKVVEYKGEEIVVIKVGGRWLKHQPTILPRGPITGQQR